MMRSTHSLAALGLAALSVVALAPATHAVVSTNPYALQSMGTISFTTPASLVGTNNTLEFLFTPGANFAPAQVTAGNFVYSNDWSIDTNTLESNPSAYFSGHDSYTYDLSGVTSVTLYDNGKPSTITPVSLFGIQLPPTVSSPDDGLKTQTQTTSSIAIPFSKVGTSASFDLGYFDPPATSTFSLMLGNTTLLAGNFDPNGVFTATTTATGVTARISPLAPPAGGTAAVPEPSSLALLGLGALPLLGIARRRASRA